MQLDNQPFVFDLLLPGGLVNRYGTRLVRKLSSMKGQYADQIAYERMLADEDVVLYEVYTIERPELAGELQCGISIVHPGKVGDEYFMTKGHFHAVLDSAEIYYCLQGQGMMVMETPEGEWAVKELQPGKVLYVPPRWAHRSVNTSTTGDLVTFYVFPGHAGHDYGTIETYGFRKLIVDRGNGAEIVDNPRWQAPEKR